MQSRATQPGNSANDMMAAITPSALRQVWSLLKAQISFYGSRLCLDSGYLFWMSRSLVEKSNDGAWERGRYLRSTWHVGRVTHPDNIGGEQSQFRLLHLKQKTWKYSLITVQMNRVCWCGWTSWDDQRRHQRSGWTVSPSGFECGWSGLDGIELHAANGYLINQFIDSWSEEQIEPTKYGRFNRGNRPAFREVVKAMASDCVNQQVWPGSIHRWMVLLTLRQ